jgi:membrane-associated phospholipid phosphatase
MLTLDERLSQVRRAPKFFTLGVPAICAAHLFLAHRLHDLRPEHLAAAVGAIVLSFWSDASRKLARVGLPFLLWLAVYDSMRWYADAIRSPVIHVKEPYDFDLRFFGIGGRTPNEWLQQRAAPALDFLCGLAYTPLFFVGESIAFSLWLVFRGHQRRAERFTWVFVVANFVGFTLYYTYPAAPPWYVAAHGFAVDLSVKASAAGALRFDKLVGVPMMEGFYSKSADVFGAIPSLHVVYPFLALFYGRRLPRFRWVALAYFLLVCFSAVYLNHHYLLDIFVGLTIAVATVVTFRLAFGTTDPEPEPALTGALVSES